MQAIPIVPGLYPMKMTRKQVREALEQNPVDRVLLGVAAAKETRLTAKQKRFAQEIAMGETKAGAYRKAYNTKAKPHTASIEGQRLMKNPSVSLQVEAITRALEAERLRTPAHLRALVIHELTETAINPEVKDAQRLKALELLGKVTEVAAFTERREVVQVKDSGDARDRLLESIRLAIKADATDADTIEGDDLLRELALTNPTESDSGSMETPPTADPPVEIAAPEPYIHTNPHNESAVLGDPTNESPSPDEAHLPDVTEAADDR